MQLMATQSADEGNLVRLTNIKALTNHAPSVCSPGNTSFLCRGYKECGTGRQVRPCGPSSTWTNFARVPADVQGFVRGRGIPKIHRRTWRRDACKRCAPSRIGPPSALVISVEELFMKPPNTGLRHATVRARFWNQYLVGSRSGYWAEELAALIKAGSTTGEAGSRPRICIISAYPDGLAPYERSELSKECLRPGATHSRDWQVRIHCMHATGDGGNVECSGNPKSELCCLSSIIGALMIVNICRKMVWRYLTQP